MKLSMFIVVALAVVRLQYLLTQKQEDGTQTKPCGEPQIFIPAPGSGSNAS